jgi:uncharacterized membrane protein YfhO
VAALQQDVELWRFTTFEHASEKTFLANAGMYYGWHDVRGYDSIVPRQYAAYAERLGLRPDSLAFNRIGPVTDRAVLDSTLLQLLNVKYVLTEGRIDDLSYREVFRDAHIAAYENASALSRSFVAPLARVLPLAEQPLEWTEPRDVVYVETDPGVDALPSGARGTSRVRAYGTNELTLDVDVEGPAWVVVGDGYAPGWHATAQAADGTTVDLAVYRAYSQVRAVRVPGGGSWSVRLWYWPDSFRLGLGISSAAALVLVAAALAWATSTRTAWVTARSEGARRLRVPS